MDVIRFEDFELDARNYCLRRSGESLKLERIPMELLLLLASQAGNLVTREEIIEKLWGQGVHLDTENAINTAIRKIRLALGDDPAQPRFVQTVTGRGYRFIAKLAESPRIALPEDGAADSARTIPRRRRWLFAGPVVAAGCLAVLAVISFRMNSDLPRASNYVAITNDGQAKWGPLLTDGLRLYFGEGSQNHRILMQVSASGGETTTLPNSLETPRLMDISPSRHDLFAGTVSPGSYNPGLDRAATSIISSPPLWVLPLPSGGVHRAGGVMADDATWSPDARDIAYVKGNELYRSRNDGTAERRIATLPGDPSWVRWSPDGSRLRFTLTDNTTGFPSIWEISGNGKMLRPILPGWNPAPSECCGSWTPDGKYFVFQSSRGGKTEIWAIKEKRGLFAVGSAEPVQLTAGQMNSLAPLVSPNGKKLYVIGQKLRGELTRYGSKSGEFVPYLSGISAECADFSTDHKWVTFVGFPERTLWRSKIDGSERLQLTFPPAQAAVPRWSPDGKRIAFFDTAPGKPWRIYQISADGGTPEPLLNERRNEIDPNWSPDGNSVMFSYFPLFEKASPDQLGIYVIDLRTRRVNKVPGSDGLWAPRWSPDGRYVVTRSLDPQSLMLFDFETQRWTELVRGVYVGFADWSADGQSVYYLRRGKDPAVMRIRVVDRKNDEIASLKDLPQTGFRGGIWMGLTPNDSPLILRDIGTEEIYALDLQLP